jgi:hypothetical protein
VHTQNLTCQTTDELILHTVQKTKPTGQWRIEQQLANSQIK